MDSDSTVRVFDSFEIHFSFEATTSTQLLVAKLWRHPEMIPLPNLFIPPCPLYVAITLERPLP